MYSANRLGSEAAPVIADAVGNTSPRRLTLKEASNGFAFDCHCALSALRRRRILWSPSRLLVKQFLAAAMKLIRSNLDDPTRTSFLVGSSKLEAASIGRPLSFPTKRECRLLAHDCVRGTAPFRTRLDNNGQTSILARASYDANDPERTFSLATVTPQHRQRLFDAVSTFGNRLLRPVELH